MMGNMDLYEKVRAVPPEAQKEIKGGRLSGFTDINPMWRIKTLTKQFGPCGIGWYYEVVDKWIEEGAGEKAAFVDIALFVKVEGEWTKPIRGTGGSKLVAAEKSGARLSDECYKMATTDAISVACKQLGIGADVYFSQDSTKYSVDAITKEQDAQIHDYVAAYAGMCSDADEKDIYQKLYSMFRFNSTEELTKEQAERVIRQLEVWYQKKKQQEETDV